MATHPSLRSGFVDDYAMERIEFRLRQLKDRFELSERDKQELRHDMVAELLSARRRFDPARAKRETFINRVLDRFVKYAMRKRCTSRDRPCDNPIGFADIMPGFEPVTNDPPGGLGDEQGRRERRLDLEAAVARMPERLQRVCRLLKVYDPAEAAQRLGINRQSIYRIMAEIRKFLTEAGLGISENSATNPPRPQM